MFIDKIPDSVSVIARIVQFDNHSGRAIHLTDLPSYPGAPRWVKLSGMIVAGLGLIVAIVVFTGLGGPHGPGRHLQSGDAGEGAPLEDATPSSQQSPRQ
jgi:hypothetical protein